MEIFGYEKRNNPSLLKLSEVTFKIKVDELKNVIAFFQHIEEKIQNYGKDFNHEHYKDFIKNTSNDADIIITAN